MKRITVIIFAGLLIFLLSGCAKGKSETITAFCGSASKPAMEEAARVFEERTGIRVYLNFGGSGVVLSQMKLSKSGDLFIPGSPDYMHKAKTGGVVYPETEKIIAYLIPAILVQEDNPKDIQELSDLVRPDVKVGIANPESVCIGLYAYEILEYNKLIEKIQKAGTIVTYAESCSKTATLIALKLVDAILGWRVFSIWHPDRIDVVYLKPEQIPRLSYIPGAISTFTKNKENAQKFLDFLTSPEAQKIFVKWGYIATEGGARKFAPNAEIGGEYKLPSTYKPLVK